jgi:hypothetical protein
MDPGAETGATACLSGRAVSVWAALLGFPAPLPCGAALATHALFRLWYDNLFASP